MTRSLPPLPVLYFVAAASDAAPRGYKSRIFTQALKIGENERQSIG
jgi:hypothetical protein